MRTIDWNGRRINVASALGAAVSRGDFEAARRMEADASKLEAIWRAKSDGAYCQRVLAGHAAARGNAYLQLALRGN